MSVVDYFVEDVFIGWKEKWFLKYNVEVIDYFVGKLIAPCCVSQ